MTPGAESDAVMAFIRERQSEVLADAVRQLSECSRDQLRPVVHAIYGSVGSYQLDDAHAAIAALSEVLHDPAATDADVDRAWANTLTTLKSMETSSL